MTDTTPQSLYLDDILRDLNEPVACGKCGKSGPKNVWNSTGKPLCPRCLSHSFHETFEPRCALCWIDRQEARGEAVRIRVFQESIAERGEDASASK